MTEVAPELELVRGFNFRVKLFLSAGAAVEPPDERRVLGDGGFQECTGLELELDVQELQEGGRNDGVIRRIGRAKYQPIVLKRGMFSATRGNPADTAIWGWLQRLSSRNEVIRYDGVVEVLDARSAKVVARWTFIRGLPAKVSGPQLNARTGEVAIEELHIAHEGLTLELH